MKEYKPFKSGKVREVYDAGDSIIMVATDRISAFDHILKNKITKKGAILTQMSKFWFDFTKDILPNHMISVDNKDMPEFFQQPQFVGNSMKCKKLTMIPMECIVRGYITGSGWESYQENGTVCGIKLPTGLKESQKLPEPIFTPSTKAELGDHDQNVSLEEGAAFVDKTFPGKGKEYVEKVRDYTIAIYKKCADYAKTRGIIIADTKFEFGLDENGERRRTLPASGRSKATKSANPSRRTTSSSSATGSKRTPRATTISRRTSSTRRLRSTKKHMRC